MSRRLSIDIRGKIIKFVEGKATGDNAVKIEKAEYLDIIGAVFKDGRLVKCDENVNLIKSFLERHKFKTNKVLLSIADAKVITRVISLPKLPFDELNELVDIEIPRNFPIDLSRFNIDYRILNTYIQDNKPFFNILLCAIPSEIIKEYVDILLECELRPVLVDVHPNSVSRLFKTIQFEDIAIIDGGIDTADLIILNGGGFSSYTTFPFEIPEYIELYRSPWEYNADQIQDQLKKLIKNVQSYFDFYVSTREGKNIDRVYITGDLALIEGIEQKFNDEFKIETHTGFDKLVEVIKPKKNADINENYINGNVGILLRGV